MSVIPYLALISAVAALGLAGYYYKAVEAAPAGNERMQFLMGEIQKGARAFLQAEYKWVGIFAVILAVILAIVITKWRAEDSAIEFMPAESLPAEPGIAAPVDAGSGSESGDGN